MLDMHPENTLRDETVANLNLRKLFTVRECLSSLKVVAATLLNGMPADTLFDVVPTCRRVDGGRATVTWSPLLCAAFIGNVATAKLLLKAGANINWCSAANGETPVIAAASRDNAEMLRILIAAGADLSMTSNTRVTALHAAAMNGRVDQIRQLLAAGMDIEAQTDTNRTALFLACEDNHPAALRELLREGACPGTTLPDGITPLTLAGRAGSAGIARELMKMPFPLLGGKQQLFFALSSASRFGHIDFIREMLSWVVHPTYLLMLLRSRHTINSWTPLHSAAAFSHPKAVQLLLEAGATVKRGPGDNDEWAPMVPCIGQGEAVEPEMIRELSSGVKGAQRAPLVYGDFEASSPEEAIRRMLARAPGYCAISWRWPATEALTTKKVAQSRRRLNVLNFRPAGREGVGGRSSNRFPAGGNILR